MNGTINTIRAAIKSKLESLDSIGEVNMYERTGFEEYPAVNVTISGNDADPNSSSYNLRTYIFTIRVFIDLAGNPVNAGQDNSKAQTETYMADVVDDILNAFDTDGTLTNSVDNVRAAPSKWGYVEVDEGWARTADITLMVSKLTSNI